MRCRHTRRYFIAAVTPQRDRIRYSLATDCEEDPAVILEVRDDGSRRWLYGDGSPIPVGSHLRRRCAAVIARGERAGA